MRRRVFLLLLAASMLAAAPSMAADITVEDAWAPATQDPGGSAAVYMRIRNAGAAPDRLIGAASAIAERAVLRGHITKGEGAMRMKTLEAIDLPAGGGVLLRPRARHVMLLGLPGALAAGDRFRLTLVFARAGPLGIEVLVRRPATRQE